MNMPVSIHPAGAIAFAAAFLFAPSSEVLAAAAALAAHEAGHWLAMRLCGICQCRIELTPFGGVADADDFDRLPPVRRALCAAAGPMISALLSWLSLSNHWNELARMNISLLWVNCLPVWPLDGARVLVSAASVFGWERAMKKALALLAWVVGAGLVALGLYGAWQGWINPSLFLAGPYLCYASRRGTVAETLKQFQQINRTLADEKLHRVHLFACSCTNIRQNQMMLLRQSHPSSTQMLLQVNPQTGQIEKMQTEKQIMEEIVAHQP